jgi:hypothetical protein
MICKYGYLCANAAAATLLLYEIFDFTYGQKACSQLFNWTFCHFFGFSIIYDLVKQQWCDSSAKQSSNHLMSIMDMMSIMHHSMGMGRMMMGHPGMMMDHSGMGSMMIGQPQGSMMMGPSNNP